jgi:hypothetical protein
MQRNNETTPLVLVAVDPLQSDTTGTLKQKKKKKYNPKRKNSDGSLDFERIVNGYSIQGK